MRIKVNLEDTTSSIWCDYHQKEVEFVNANRLQGPIDVSLSTCTHWDTSEEGRSYYENLSETGLNAAMEQQIKACRASWYLLVEDGTVTRRVRPTERASDEK